MPYCTKCGHQFDDAANFCPNCGAPASQTLVQDQRKQTFAGDIQKCPSCGEPLTAFELVCHACGHELRNIEVSSAVQRLSDKIAKLEASRGKNNTTVITKDGKKSSKVVHKGEDTTDAQIASTIRNFPIPNTKEDVFEFMVLASSNIDVDRLDADYYGEEETMLSRAWYTKFEQVYQKARLAFGDSPDFHKIQVIYDDKKREIKTDKKVFKDILDGGKYFLYFAGLIVVMIVAFFVIDKKAEPENLRLEAIVEEIYECIEEENYALARAKTANLVFSGSNKNAAEKWEKTRQEMYAIIDKAEGIEPSTITKDEPEEKEEGFLSSAVDGLKNAFGF